MARLTAGLTRQPWSCRQEARGRGALDDRSMALAAALAAARETLVGVGRKTMIGVPWMIDRM